MRSHCWTQRIVCVVKENAEDSGTSKEPWGLDVRAWNVMFILLGVSYQWTRHRRFLSIYFSKRWMEWIFFCPPQSQPTLYRYSIELNVSNKALSSDSSLDWSTHRGVRWHPEVRSEHSLLGIKKTVLCKVLEKSDI